jgi:hypothetical protein
MNCAFALIEEVAARGARIYLREGELKFAFRGEAPTDLIEKLRAHKPELIRALAPVSLEWRRAEADYENECQARACSTLRFCQCGDFASNAWPNGRGGEQWFCPACEPVGANIIAFRKRGRP